MIKTFIYIGMGGAIGSVLRYLTQLAVSRYFTSIFPLGTFVANILGCLLIGIFYGIADKHAWLNLEWRLFLMTGLCGGFTTFSSFSYEGLNLLKQGNYVYFAMYVSFSVLLGLLAAFLGVSMIR